MYTPQIYALCWQPGSATLKDINRIFKRLAFVVHPDRVARIDLRWSNSCRSTLSRAFQQAKSEVEYVEKISGRKPQEISVGVRVFLSHAMTAKEEYLQGEQKKEDARKEQEQLEREERGRAQQERAAREQDQWQEEEDRVEEAQGPTHAEKENHEESAEIPTSEDLSDDGDYAALSLNGILVLDGSFDPDDYIVEFVDVGNEDILDGKDGNSAAE